ncbi:hypothetical protein BGP77_06360 [Saccharospirillum sp. MSK14-1]|nr:hypothetical protein BGP77_06360 [Saccharospirillum sp. MSK14-1]
MKAANKIQFHWQKLAKDETTDYDSYRIQANLGDSELINKEIAAGSELSFTKYISMFDHRWTDAVYRLSGCLAGACDDIGSALIAYPDHMLKGMGYMKSFYDVTQPVAGQHFGMSVNVSSNGRYMAVSARKVEESDGLYPGAVYIYARTEDGYWEDRSILRPKDRILSDGAAEGFGWSLSFSSDGKYLAVGAPFQTDGLKENEGMVYIYELNDLGNYYEWRCSSAMVDHEQAQFGYSVSFNKDGRYIAIGAPFDSTVDPNGQAVGSVYVLKVNLEKENCHDGFVRFSDRNKEPETRFGQAVALSGEGDRLAVGASRANRDGMVVMFAKNRMGNWDQGNMEWTVYLSAISLFPNNSAFVESKFGEWLAMSDDGKTIAVAARDYSGNGKASGAVVTFTLNENLCEKFYYGALGECNLWASDNTILTPNNIAELDQFGFRLSMRPDGEMIAISSIYENGADYGVLDEPGSSSEEISKAGAVYLYKRNLPDGNGWTHIKYIKASNPGENDQFGYSVSLSNAVLGSIDETEGTLLVGAPFEDRKGAHTMRSGFDSRNDVSERREDSGAAYLY